MADKDYQTVLLEQIREQNKALLEGQKDQATRGDIRRLEQRLDAVEGDMKVIKDAVKDVSDEQTETRRFFGASRADRKRFFSAR